jgi:hypothetical protein
MRPVAAARTYARCKTGARQVSAQPGTCVPGAACCLPALTSRQVAYREDSLLHLCMCFRLLIALPHQLHGAPQRPHCLDLDVGSGEGHADDSAAALQGGRQTG